MSAQRTAKAGRSVYVPPNARGSGSSRQVYQDTPQATVARSSENDSTTRDHKTRTVEARPTGRRGKAGHSRRARGSMDNAADETGLSSTGTIVSTPLRKQDEAEIVERPVEPEKHLEKPTDTRTLSRSSSRDRPKNERKGSPVEPDCGKFERQCDLQASVGHAQAPVSSAIHIVSSNNNPTTGYREAVRISLNDGPHNRREPRKARSQYVPPGRRGEDDRGYGEENARHIAALSHDVSGVAKSLGSTAQSSSATDDALIAAEDAAGVSPDADESLSSPKLQSCQETATKAARMKEERTSSKGIISLRETQTRVQQDPYVSPTIHEGEDFKSEHRLGLGNQGGVESDAGPVAARVACPRDRTEEVSAAAHLGSDAEAAFLLSEAATEANAVAVGGSTAEQNSVEIVDLRAESVADTGVATVGGRCSRSVHTGTTCATESWSKSDFTDAVTDFTDAVTAETVGARDRQRDVHDSTVASGTEGNSPRGEDQSESTLTALVDTTEIFTKVSPFKTVSAPYIPPGRRKMMEAAPQTAPEATGGDAMGGSTGIGPLWTFRAPVRVSQRARPTDGESSPSRPPPSRVAAVVSGGMSAYGANIEEYSGKRPGGGPSVLQRTS